MNEYVTSAVDRLQKEIDAKLEAFNRLSPSEKEAVLRMQAESIKEEYKPGEHQGVYGDTPDSLSSYVKDHRAFAEVTFIGSTAGSITKHIEKECVEVRKDPNDLEEWIDIMILAIDGYWRHGGVPEELLPRLRAKQRKNMSRKWVLPKVPGDPIEHDRSDEVAA